MRRLITSTEARKVAEVLGVPITKQQFHRDIVSGKIIRRSKTPIGLPSLFTVDQAKRWVALRLAKRMMQVNAEEIITAFKFVLNEKD